MSGSFNAGFTQLATDGEGAHYALEVDFANYAPLFNAINAANEMLIKYTIECGNDTIIGRTEIPSIGLTSVPDSGTTLALFGLGLGGLSMFRTRRAANRR